MSTPDARRWIVAGSSDAVLESTDPHSTPGAPGDKQATERASEELRKRLIELQLRLWAENRQSLLVVLQAMDAGGKDGAVRKVFSGVNPQGCRVTSFKQPSEEELAHDFLWRIHKAVPRQGEIGVFNRSHYEDVVAVRVRKLVPKHEWKQRYGIINQFESSLVASGTRVVKAFLHISKEEQAERLRKRLENPSKRWKFRKDDLLDRALWGDYQVAYQDAIAATATEHAPWFVIPADRKWYRDWALLTVLVATLEEMDPSYPEPADDLSKIVID
jgi:PPK2 family polyphosphate:nucleotide phosphotransferase